MLVNDISDLSQAESHILHPGTRKLFRYWEGIRAERAAPNRDDLDLKQITAIVPNLMMLERDHMRLTYNWRVAGTATCKLLCQELTGTDALAGWGKFERDTMTKLLDKVVTSLQPCLIRFRLTTNTDDVIGAEMLGLPLHARNGSRFHVFGGVFPFRDASTLNYDHIVDRELSGARTIWTEHLPGDQLVAQLANSSRPKAGLRVIEGGRKA
jgi:hypothetical protein